MAEASATAVLASAHDLSEGGLAIALAESCLRGKHGCRVSLPGDPFTALFSESPARAVVSVTPGREDEFATLCTTHAVPATALGVTGGHSLTVNDTFDIPLDELRQVWEATLPALFG
jgi:phosphoribosylformylglycinamidine synthase